jgi:hypothetical protein
MRVEPLFDSLGYETPHGTWHLCGCGDLIPVGDDACASCRVEQAAADDE